MLDRDVVAAALQRHDQFDLVMHVAWRRRDRETSPSEYEIVGVLLEEERRLLVRVVAHLDRMRGIVAADAVDRGARGSCLGAADGSDGQRRVDNHEDPSWKFSLSMKGQLRASGVIFEPAFQPGEQLVDGEGEGEKHEEQRPHVLHQEVRGVDFEQLPEADDGDQQLADDDAFDRADQAEPDAGEDFRQRRPDDRSC